MPPRSGDGGGRILVVCTAAIGRDGDCGSRSRLAIAFLKSIGSELYRYICGICLGLYEWNLNYLVPIVCTMHPKDSKPGKSSDKAPLLLNGDAAALSETEEDSPPPKRRKQTAPKSTKLSETASGVAQSPTSLILEVSSYDHEQPDNYSDSEQEEEEEEEEYTPARGARGAKNNKTKKKRKPRKPAVRLTDEQMIDILDWVKQRPQFYDKRHKGWANQKEYDHMWVTKAEEMGFSHWRDVKTGWESMRTRYCRVHRLRTKSDSDSDFIRLTDRDHFVWKHASFLYDFINHQLRRAAPPAKKSIPSSASTPEQGNDEMVDDVDPSYAPLPLAHRMPVPQWTPPERDILSAAALPSTSTSDTSAQLMNINLKLLAALQPQLSKNPVTQKFGEYIVSALDSMPQDIMDSCMEEMMTSLHRHRRTAFQRDKEQH